MKTYRLKHKYPGSPEVGTVVDRADNNDILAEYPEFWEDITKPKFITEDRVAKHVGDTYYKLYIYKDTNSFIVDKLFVEDKDYNTKSNNTYYFNNPHVAENYALARVVLLSIHEFHEALQDREKGVYEHAREKYYQNYNKKDVHLYLKQ